MAWPVTSNPLRADEALDWFNDRVPILEKDLAKLKGRAKQRGFTVAGANQLSVVSSVLTEIERAVKNGEDIAEFRKRVKKKLKGDWTKADSARLDTIFITNTQTSLNRGRYAQLTKPETLATRPFWLYDAVLDSRTTFICESLNGTIRPASDPYWNNHVPPMHMRCRSGLRALRRKVAKEAGVTRPRDKPFPKIPKGFGKAPQLQRPFRPRKEDFPADAWAEFKKKQKALRRADRERNKGRPRP